MEIFKRKTACVCKWDFWGQDVGGYMWAVSISPGGAAWGEGGGGRDMLYESTAMMQAHTIWRGWLMTH